MSKKVSHRSSITNQPTCGGPIKAGLAPRSTNFMMGVKRNHHFRGQPFKDDEKDYACFEEEKKYIFLRNGESTVSFSGQTARLHMLDELYSTLGEPTTSSDKLKKMFSNTQDDSSSLLFANADLNTSGKDIKSKTAASTLMGNSDAVRAAVEAFLDSYPVTDKEATDGNKGHLERDDGSKIYVDSKGIEQKQAVIKSLIGALCLDQIVNNYLHQNQLDSGTRTDDNTAGTMSSGKNYTDMEHKWDEAFGYLYGQLVDVTTDEARKATAKHSNGKTGNALYKYFEKANSDKPHLKGIAERVYDAFVKGRQAIVNAQGKLDADANTQYAIRDQQAAIIKKELSHVIAEYAIHYLQGYLNDVEAGATKGEQFHGLAEGYGFVMSLQFMNDGEDERVFEISDVNDMLSKLSNFWAVDQTEVTAMISVIDEKIHHHDEDKHHDH
jgi:hypothetical protein